MSDWFVPLRPAGGPVRLVVFPHAGGGPASLTPLVPLLPAGIAPWSVNLPGRQARLAEQPRTDLDGLVDDLAAALVASVPAPYALFGYCSGALLAYLVGRRLGEWGAAPQRLLVGSFAAPDVAPVPRRLHQLPAELFWAQLVAAGGIPAELAGRTDLRPVLEPALRADFALLAGYRHAPGPPLDTPVTVLYGRHDRSVTRGGLLGWRRHSRYRPVLRGLDAAHWLVEEAPDELAAAIAEQFPRPEVPACDSDTA
ncbi:thioesterase II family protein [Micromonospora echinofusca]|uniref:Thioesterase n=1 Tax=Micromonospora echinofusca TaxID=47858 RepID=A0ABS3VSI6_MICEH|nr:thioesterase domain-containing protein [Micromonospora echinofusca]MBO4207517.1 thioesterase [Micromonospora echinofusca]